MEETQIHQGHRRRLLDRYQKTGLRGFSDVEILELLLAYAIPRRDTNPIAHRLLDRFSGLDHVLEAPEELLTQVEGVTARAAMLLTMIPAVWGRYDQSRWDRGIYLSRTEDYGAALLPHFRGVRDEQVWLLCMDAKCKFLQCVQLCHGSVGSTNLSVRRVVETALGVNASMVVLAHNHPTGLATPSREDVESTRTLRSALQMVDVVLVDHLIVADEDFVSLRDSGLMREEAPPQQQE